jgi:hypothetical protein
MRYDEAQILHYLTAFRGLKTPPVFLRPDIGAKCEAALNATLALEGVTNA